MIEKNIQRFILTSIDSVPHWEAILLLRYDQEMVWDAKKIAQTLYISEKKACTILTDLCTSHFITKKNTHFYHYKPGSLELKNTIDQLADIYANNLIEVTNLIHSKTDNKADAIADKNELNKKKRNSE